MEDWMGASFFRHGVIQRLHEARLCHETMRYRELISSLLTVSCAKRSYRPKPHFFDLRLACKKFRPIRRFSAKPEEVAVEYFLAKISTFFFGGGTLLRSTSLPQQSSTKFSNNKMQSDQNSILMAVNSSLFVTVTVKIQIPTNSSSRPIYSRKKRSTNSSEKDYWWPLSRKSIFSGFSAKHQIFRRCYG